LKGSRVQEEIVAAGKQIRTAGLHDVEVLELGVGIVPEATRVFRATVD
jgi:16S rRNA (guanine527-N7)-methyltransferase